LGVAATCTSTRSENGSSGTINAVVDAPVKYQGRLAASARAKVHPAQWQRIGDPTPTLQGGDTNVCSGAMGAILAHGVSAFRGKGIRY